MKISMIAAMAENRVIGRSNDLPWHIPEDLRYFMDTTLHKPVVMGRKTFDSLGKLLPKRPNLILTRQKDWSVEGAQIFSSLEESLEFCRKTYPDEECFVIGGQQIYEQAMPLADRLYLTVIHRSYEGDSYFPEVNWEDFQIVKKDFREGDPAYTFLVADRVRS